MELFKTCIIVAGISGVILLVIGLLLPPRGKVPPPVSRLKFAGVKNLQDR